MRAHYLQHVPFEGLGSIENWLKLKGYQITSTQLYKEANFPEINEIDLLVVMGGPMSVNDEKEFPWLIDEKQFVKAMIEAGKPVLGICLGAQMIANALGARIYPNTKKEIGWFPIENKASAMQDLFQFPESAVVFHWHGETFDLPANSRLLASSKACVNQAFQLGTHVIGLQFHLETTSKTLLDISTNCADEIVDDEFIQASDEMKKSGENYFEGINKLMNQVLEFITRK